MHLITVASRLAKFLGGQKYLLIEVWILVERFLLKKEFVVIAILVCKGWMILLYNISQTIHKELNRIKKVSCDEFNPEGQFARKKPRAMAWSRRQPLGVASGGFWIWDLPKSSHLSHFEGFEFLYNDFTLIKFVCTLTNL